MLGYGKRNIAPTSNVPIRVQSQLSRITTRHAPRVAMLNVAPTDVRLTGDGFRSLYRSCSSCVSAHSFVLRGSGGGCVAAADPFATLGVGALCEVWCFFFPLFLDCCFATGGSSSTTCTSSSSEASGVGSLLSSSGSSSGGRGSSDSVPSFRLRFWACCSFPCWGTALNLLGQAPFPFFCLGGFCA